MATGEPTSQSISAITPKIPPFYAKDPDLWFLRAESAFHTAKPRITDDETKMAYLIQSLDEETALRIKDLLMKPEMSGQFEVLKTRLTKTFGLKRHERAALIIDYPDIGDGSAMKLADDYMRLHDEDDSILLRELFLRHLPVHVRAIIEEDETKDLRVLAEREDKIRKENARIAAISSQSTTAAILKQDMKKTTDKNWCYYHECFGANAKKCRSPCSFTGNAEDGRQ